MIKALEQHPDSDTGKGAVESDQPQTPGKDSTSNESMAGQLGHRDSNTMLKDNDTDFPEPNAAAEHSG